MTWKPAGDIDPIDVIQLAPSWLRNWRWNLKQQPVTERTELRASPDGRLLVAPQRSVTR
jgi:hypothetical protein